MLIKLSSAIMLLEMFILENLFCRNLTSVWESLFPVWESPQLLFLGSSTLAIVFG